MRELKPLQPVVSYRFVQSSYSRAGSGSWMITLECGHLKRQKSAISVPTRARCTQWDCKYKPREEANA